MEALIAEHAEAVAKAGHPPPALQLNASSWNTERWGGVAESFLRPWTLASVRRAPSPRPCSSVCWRLAASRDKGPNPCTCQ